MTRLRPVGETSNETRTETHDRVLGAGRNLLVANRFPRGHLCIAVPIPRIRTVPCMTVLSRGRHIECEGTFNIRDIGGYPTSCGRQVRSRLAYRADGLHRIPPGGPRALDHLGLRTVIDLRTPTEVSAGAFAAKEAVVINLPILRATWGIQEAPITDPVSFLSTHYLEMLEEGATAIAASFDVLSSPARLPAVFHCSAGKDRTGVLAALVLSVLGVPAEIVAADYNLSAEPVQRLAAWLKSTGRDSSEEMSLQPKTLLSCPVEAMQAFLDAVDRTYGSVERYLLGVDVQVETLERLRHVLLEPT